MQKEVAKKSNLVFYFKKKQREKNITLKIDKMISKGQLPQPLKKIK